MTLPSGDDIGYALKRLRMRAVDAFMLGPGTPERRMRWNTQDDGLGEDFYTEGDVSWTCPNSDGYNGGQSVGPIDAKDYSGDFFRIYDRISDSTTRWTSIPDSTKIGGLRAKSDPLVKSLTHHLAGKDGTFQGCGSLISNIEYVKRELMGADDNPNGRSDADEGLQGTAVLLFKEYFGDLIRAILACQQIVVVLDGAVAAEEQLWGAVRNDVPQSIHRLAGACKRIAGGSSARVDLDGVLNGTALGLGVASVVISGPVGVTIGIVSLGLSVVTMSGVTGTEGFDAIEYLNPQPAPPRTCDNALDVLQQLSQAFMDADTSGLGSDDSAPGVGRRLVREVTEMVPLIIPDLWRMRG